MSTYEEICKQRCPDGCGTSGVRKLITPAGFCYHLSGGIDDGEGISGGHSFACTAPTLKQVIEEMGGEIERLKGLINGMPHEPGACPVAIWKVQCGESTRFEVWNPKAPECNCAKSKVEKS